VLSAEKPNGYDSLRSALEKVFDVSAFLNYPFTLEEVVNYFLPNCNMTSEGLRSLVANGIFPEIPFGIEKDFLIARPTQSLALRMERQRFSSAKLDAASNFASILDRLVPFIRTIAVTGSVAYGSADKWDDIDLFIVTERDRLWLSVLVALILVRITKMLRLRPPHLLSICLSYVHDELGFALDSSRNRVNPLFARELLMAKPVLGEDHYRKILERSDWVGEIYARPYQAKIHRMQREARSEKEGWALFLFFSDWAEGIVFIFLSRYLRVRAYLTNLKLKSQGEKLRLFEPRISSRSCVYTSNFYKWLHALWGE